MTSKSQSEIRQEAFALLKKANYAGLEALVSSLKAKEYLIDERPALSKFHSALSLDRKSSEQAFLQRQKALEAWVAAIPESSSARTALGEWLVDYAWKARGYIRLGQFGHR